MKYLFSLAAMLLCTMSAFAADFTTVSTTPANGQNVDQVASVTLTYAEAVTVDTSKLPFFYVVTEEGETQLAGSVAELSEDGLTVTLTPLIFVGFPMPITLYDDGCYVIHLAAGFVTSANGSSLAEDLTFTIGAVPTSISGVEMMGKAQIFDQQGRKVTEMQPGNVYIVNGKKVICQ